MPRERLPAGHAGIGDLAERFSRGYVAEMNFDGGQGDGFQRVQNGDGRMRIGCGIDDDAVELAERLLNPIDENALVVGLAYIDSEAELGRGLLNEGDKRGVVLFAVDIRFTDAKHIEIRTVNNKNVFHGGGGHRWDAVGTKL